MDRVSANPLASFNLLEANGWFPVSQLPASLRTQLSIATYIVTYVAPATSHDSYEETAGGFSTAVWGANRADCLRRTS